MGAGEMPPAPSTSPGDAAPVEWGILIERSMLMIVLVNEKFPTAFTKRPQRNACEDGWGYERNFFLSLSCYFDPLLCDRGKCIILLVSFYFNISLVFFHNSRNRVKRKLRLDFESPRFPEIILDPNNQRQSQFFDSVSLFSFKEREQNPKRINPSCGFKILLLFKTPHHY